MLTKLATSSKRVETGPLLPCHSQSSSYSVGAHHAHHKREGYYNRKGSKGDYLPTGAVAARYHSRDLPDTLRRGGRSWHACEHPKLVHKILEAVGKKYSSENTGAVWINGSNLKNKT